jgi:hypothetical protein
MSWADDPRARGNRPPMSADDMEVQRLLDDAEAAAVRLLVDRWPDAADWTEDAIADARAEVLAGLVGAHRPAPTVEPVHPRPEPVWEPETVAEDWPAPIAQAEPEEAAVGEPAADYAEELERYLVDAGVWRPGLSEREQLVRADYAASPMAAYRRHQKMWVRALAARADAVRQGDPVALAQCAAATAIVATADAEAGVPPNAAIKDRALTAMGRHGVFVDRWHRRYAAALAAEERALRG